MDKAALGKKGEAIAAKYYLDRGYILLAHNYKCRMGELDLVLMQGETLVVAEVKTRSPGSLTAPAEAVNFAKQRRIISTVKHYTYTELKREYITRFDVVEIVPLPQGGYQVHHIPDAFRCV